MSKTKQIKKSLLAFILDILGYINLYIIFYLQNQKEMFKEKVLNMFSLKK